jgi:hypothetical protein
MDCVIRASRLSALVAKRSFDKRRTEGSQRRGADLRRVVGYLAMGLGQRAVPPPARSRLRAVNHSVTASLARLEPDRRAGRRHALAR